MVENSEIPHLRDTVEELRYSESKVVSFYEGMLKFISTMYTTTHAHVQCA